MLQKFLLKIRTAFKNETGTEDQKFKVNLTTLEPDQTQHIK